jgi:putative phosphoesterase
MKIMFISDIHGSKANLKKIREIYDREEADIIIILGDLFLSTSSTDEIEKIINTFPNKVVIKGNNDSVTDIFRSTLSFLDEYCFTAFDKKFFCTHGNVYNITRLPKKKFDVLVYGHTHNGMLIRDGERYYINPGSISYPRNGALCSYIVIDEKGIYLKNLDEMIVDKILW